MTTSDQQEGGPSAPPWYPITITPEEVTTHREDLAAWVQANGIDPHTVPLGHPIRVEKGVAGPVIVYRAYVRNERGWLQIDPENDDEALTVECTAPCTVPPPDLGRAPGRAGQ
ncbi:hypothetical protein [Streptomyces sp. bgisy154]|uniref:hypothetical protein n=1 Tax=Streptomyces sp. bgisy154 TaxID=3413794 RepID=UPI003D72629B